MAPVLFTAKRSSTLGRWSMWGEWEESVPEPSAPLGRGSYLGLGTPACPGLGKVVQLCSVQPSPTHTHTHTHGNVSCMDSSLHWNIGIGEPSIGLVWVSPFTGLLSLRFLVPTLGVLP